MSPLTEVAIWACAAILLFLLAEIVTAVRLLRDVADKLDSRTREPIPLPPYPVENDERTMWD